MSMLIGKLKNKKFGEGLPLYIYVVIRIFLAPGYLGFPKYLGVRTGYVTWPDPTSNSIEGRIELV